jgi:hypothetical protein
VLRSAALGALLLAFASAGCTMQSIEADPKIAAETAYVKIVEQTPSGKCRYVGEAVSFRQLVSRLGIDILHMEGTVKEKHDVELRQRAKELGANTVEIAFSQDTGFAYLIQVNRFLAC